MEALTFARFVFELESFRTLCASRKCLGLGSAKKARLPSRAAPLRVGDLILLRSILRESADYWDRLFAGCCLFCVYARARWSDAQHAGEFEVDADQKSSKTAFFEAIVELHKTMNRKGKEPVCLELVSPGLGVTFDDWVRQFLNVREKLGISRAYPFMPAPNTSSSSRSSSPSSSSSSVSRPFRRPIKEPPVPPEGHRFVQHPALKTLHYQRLEHVLRTICGRKTEDVYQEPCSVRATTPVCRNCQKILKAEIAT